MLRSLGENCPLVRPLRRDPTRCKAFFPCRSRAPWDCARVHETDERYAVAEPGVLFSARVERNRFVLHGQLRPVRKPISCRKRVAGSDRHPAQTRGGAWGSSGAPGVLTRARVSETP